MDRGRDINNTSVNKYRGMKRTTDWVIQKALICIFKINFNVIRINWKVTVQHFSISTIGVMWIFTMKAIMMMIPC